MFIIVLLLAVPLSAQVGHWNQLRFCRGENSDVNYAFAVAGGQDVDGDGVDDVIVVHGMRITASVLVLERPLFTLEPPALRFTAMGCATLLRR